MFEGGGWGQKCSCIREGTTKSDICAKFHQNRPIKTVFQNLTSFSPLLGGMEGRKSIHLSWFWFYSIVMGMRKFLKPNMTTIAEKKIQIWHVEKNQVSNF